MRESAFRARGPHHPSPPPDRKGSYMKSSSRLVIATISIAILAGVTDSVQAQDKYALTGNAAVVSDYRYRGITQTRFDPALQVGADLGLPNGLYAGVWATNIKWIKDAGGKGSSEIDLYGGYKTELSKDLLLDVGVLRYQYREIIISKSLALTTITPIQLNYTAP